MVQNLTETKRLSKKIFQTLPPNFVKGCYKSCLKFHPFCMNESEQNAAKGYFMLISHFFMPRIKIKEIFDAILKSVWPNHLVFSVIK